MLERYLEDLEKRILPEVEDELYNSWKSFTDGKFEKGYFFPQRRRSVPAILDWPDVSVNNAIGSCDAMALQQYGVCSKTLAMDSGALPAVRCNYGTVILPSIFGAELFVMDEKLNTLPGVRPLAGGAADVGKLLDRGVPDLCSGLGGKVLEMAEVFAAIGRQYPLIGKYITIYHPDLQGPMDVCEMLWGSSLFLEIYDNVGLVHELLLLITQTYIAYMCEWYKLLPPAGDYAVHWQMLHRGRIMLRNDSAMNLSPQMYEEFIRPYDQMIFDKFGGGGIHFCGRGDHYIKAMSAMRGLYAVAMSQPELNDMEAIYDNTLDKGINLIGFPRAYAEASLRSGRDFHGRMHCF